MAAIPELELLRPVEDELLDEPESWPVFQLTDVNVTLADDTARQTGLFGSAHRPRRLIGRLKALPADQKHRLAIKPTRKALVIELQGAIKNAYQLKEDGELALRATGRAGHYELQPSKDYQPVWDLMTEMANLLDALTRIHQTKSKTTRRGKQDYPQVDDLFRYLDRTGYAKADLDFSAEQRIYEYHAFLLGAFFGRHRGLDWPSTPICQHLADEFPDQARRLKSYFDQKASHANGDQQQTLPIRTSAAQRTRKRSYAAANEAEPSTPRTNETQDRRRYAMKGRSALRPSAMKPGTRRSSRLNSDLDEDDEEHDVTPLKTRRRDEDIDPAMSDEHGREDDEHYLSDSEEDAAANEPDGARGIDGQAGVPAEEEESVTTIWSCSVHGCAHQVVASSLPDAQLLLDEHMSLHAYDDDARVQLVRRLQHASLPVSHLMERVRIQARAEDLSTR